jgi:hypothetical protein
LEIDKKIKSIFKQTRKISFTKRLNKKIIAKIKNNWFIRKVLFLIENKNSIKLRVYTKWKIYKINRSK